VKSPDDLGDCIDCTICVQVCPTGIDIRNGLQYECIACGACVDACDTVMDKLGYPRGLVRYTTQNAVDGKPSRVLRPRILVYGLLLSLIAVGWVIGVGNRTPLIVDVLRDRNALYRFAADGSIENGYTLKLSNKAGEARSYVVRIESDAALTLDGAPLKVEAGAEATLNLPITLRAAAGAVSGRPAGRFVVEAEGEPPLSVAHEAAFFGPAP
jgi:cytochrome c oxidase accessory protein FixG